MATTGGKSASAKRFVTWRIAGSAVFTCAAACILLNPLLKFLIEERRFGDSWRYNALSFGISYFDTGFARREMIGTIARLLSNNILLGALIVHCTAIGILSVVALAALLLSPADGLTKTICAGVMLAALVRLAPDVGRSDSAVMLCGAAAAWTARSGRWVIAAAFLSLALTIHETGLIVLAPIAAVAAYEGGKWRTSSRRSLIVGAVCLAISLGAYILAVRHPPDIATVGRLVHARFNADGIDFITYLQLSGARGLRTVQCFRQLDHGYTMKMAKGVALIVGIIAAARPTRPLMSLAAVLPPYLFLSFIAVDVARWTVFAVYGVVVLALCKPSPQPPKVWAAARLGAAALAALAIGAAPASGNPYDPAPMVPPADAVQPNYYNAVDRCDPTWREAIGLTAKT